MKRKAPRGTVDLIKASFDDYPRMRIRWIDRVTRVIMEPPGAPPSTAIARSCIKLLAELETYRDGFVHAVNMSRQKP